MDLLTHCQASGMLSKEAAEKVLAHRESLVRAALRKQAAVFFESLRHVELEKDAGIGSALFGARKAVPAGEGFLSRFRHGGRTGGAGTVAAGWKDVGANLAKMLSLAGLTAGASQGVGALMKSRRNKAMKAEIESSYKQMFEEVPRLKELHEEQPESVQRNFGILAKFAPSLAAVPSIAGTWVSQVARTGQIDVATIKTLAETQRKIDEAHEGKGASTPKLAPMRAGEFVNSAMLGDVRLH